MNGLFSFGIFTTEIGYALIGICAALMVILWDWRVGVPGLILVQWGISSLLVQRFNMPEEWAAAFLFLAVLSGIMLSLSALQVRWNQHVPRAGVLPLRLLVVALVYLFSTSQALNLPIPLIDTPTITLFTWLALMALVMLVLGESPLHTGLSLVLWLVPVQAVTAVLLPNPALIVVMGSAQLTMVLACSYLILPASASGLRARQARHNHPGHIPGAANGMDAAAAVNGSKDRHGRRWLQRLGISTPGGQR